MFLSAAFLAPNLAFALAAATPTHVSYQTGPNPEVNVNLIDGFVSVDTKAGGLVNVDAAVDAGGGWVVESSNAGGKVSVRVCCGTCDGHQHGCSRDSGARVTVQVPPTAALSVHSVSAGCRVRGVAGAVAVRSVSANVDVEGTSGPLSVHNVSGPVTLSPAALDKVEVNSVSGEVEVALPRGADAQVDQRSVSGSRNGPARATFGKGTHRVNVTTVSGAIDVHERKP
jgi:hypothetical protein